MDMQSNDERGAEKQMDDYLKTLGLHRKKIAKDGSCLFRAVAEQVLHCQSLHTKVRAQCVEFLKKNREVYEAFIEGDFEDYLCKLQDPQQWVGEVEINALAVMYKRDFLIYQEPGKPAVPITNNNFKDKVRLCFLNENHYDSVYPTSHIKSAAICQSILYELLYDNVFKVDPAALSNICNLTNRPNYVLSDDNLPPCVSSDESELDTSDVLRVENGTTSTKHGHKGRGRGRMSDRLRRSLNPTLYRNVEFDVWHKTKRAQQKLDYCIAAGMQYSVGDRCQVRLEGGRRSYNATITEVPPNNSTVTVYIEELGKKQVPLWCVRHPSDETSWSTVANRDKRISNGHGEWDERGKGRGRGKSNTASSSVSQATAPGSGGRVQKQHSWPQVTAEEQGGTKTSRSMKSPSTSESVMFGLTEEERLAKEEEERNVALVEIQLRDEHSFPALGTQAMQGDGGKRKGGEKRKSQRNKTKSPVEDVFAGERPKSSTPPLATTTAPTTPTTNTTKATNPTRPAAKPPAAASTNSESSPARLSSLKASTPSANMGPASGSTAKPPPACAALTTKPNTQSYASAAGGPPSSPPPPAPSATAPTSKPPVAGGAPPHSVPSSASVFSFVTPVLPPASPSPSSSSPSPRSSSKLPTSSLSSLPPKSSASPPPSSSVSPPTFIAPIAPVAAQGFLPASSFPRSSLPHSPSPPSLSPSTVQISSSSSVNHHAAPSAPAQTPDSLPHAEDPLTAPQTLHDQSSLSQIHPQEYQSQSSVSQTQTQTSSSQAEITSQSFLSKVPIQSQASVPQNKVMRPQMQADIQYSVPQLQHQPQPHTEAASLPQTQTQPPVLQLQSQANYPSQTQSEFTHLQSSHPAPGASYPHIPQDPIPVSASVQPQPPITQPHLQPPHPSQVPQPSLSLSAPLTHPSVQSQTPNTQDKVEAPPPAAQQLQAESPAHPPSQQSQPPHPPLHSAHTPLPPVPQAIPGTFPLQQLSQLFHDPLYPGFPQTENGSVAPTPPLSSCKSGDDLPQDVSILRFFFNLGVKAYTVPVFAPCVYLMPLQQAYAMQPMQPKLPSRSPSPTTHFSPSNPPARHQEAYPQYPPNSASVPTQYDQASLTEPPRPSEPSFNQAGYPVTHPPPHRMPWQQQQVPPPRNSSYPAGLPSTAPPYPVSLAPQGYPSGQDPGHPPFAPTMTPYPPSSLGYHQSSTPEEFQASQTTIAHLQPANGDTLAGHALGRVPGPLEGPAAANVANANNNRTMVAHGVNSYGFKKEQEESVLLVDPPLNNTPIHVTMTTMKPSSIPGSHDIVSKSTVSIDNSPSHVYRPTRKPYVKMETSQGSYLHPISMPDGLSVACSTEDDWEEKEVFNPPTSNHRGPRRGSRGGRGRGGYDVRGQQRRRQEVGTRYPHNQYGPPHGNWSNY